MIIRSKSGVRRPTVHTSRSLILRRHPATKPALPLYLARALGLCSHCPIPPRDALDRKLDRCLLVITDNNVDISCLAQMTKRFASGTVPRETASQSLRATLTT